MNVRLLSLGFALCGEVVAVGACFRSLPPPSELAPISVTVHRPANDVVRAAAQLLATEQFQVDSSGSAKGALVATRTRTIAEQGGEIACDRSQPSSAAGPARMTIAIRATQRQDGTQLLIATSVHRASVQQASGDISARSAEDCVSTGAVEQRIINALLR